MKFKMTQKYLIASEGDGNQAQIQEQTDKRYRNKISAKSLLITNISVKAQHLAI
jgi:hypothetical protein